MDLEIRSLPYFSDVFFQVLIVHKDVSHCKSGVALFQHGSSLSLQWLFLCQSGVT